MEVIRTVYFVDITRKTYLAIKLGKFGEDIYDSLLFECEKVMITLISFLIITHYCVFQVFQRLVPVVGVCKVLRTPSNLCFVRTERQKKHL